MRRSKMKNNKYIVFFGPSSLSVAVFLMGCSNMPLLDPKGPIGTAERFVIVASFVLMLIVVIPVVVLSFWFPRRFRASNTKATYTPKWNYSVKIDLAMWLVPVAIITALGVLSWNATHRLDPYKPIDTGVKPISIEVVSLDWKWLFIYPDQDIAVVNQLVFPVGVPLSFRLTSDTVLTSFFIPQLGSQIYAMAGRQTRLHLLADESGTYAGHNQQFSGRGYADMHFKAMAVPREQFDAWVQKTRQSQDSLDLTRYEKLEIPSVDHRVTYFSSVKPDLFDHIVRKYMAVDVNPGVKSKDAGSTNMKISAVEGR